MVRPPCLRRPGPGTVAGGVEPSASTPPGWPSRPGRGEPSGPPDVTVARSCRLDGVAAVAAGTALNTTGTTSATGAARVTTGAAAPPAPP